MLSFILVIIGGLNWGLVGLGGFLGGDWNVVHMILGSWPSVESFVYLLVGIGTFTLTLANPFWLTFNIDHYQDLGLEKTMAIREAYLNLGYIAALALGFFVYLFTDSVKYGLVLVSAVCLLLPLASYWQGVYND